MVIIATWHARKPYAGTSTSNLVTVPKNQPVEHIALEFIRDPEDGCGFEDIIAYLGVYA
jgi:hypothetical protein